MNPKLQKLLAELGLASRRQSEEWIKAGRVIVNGQIAKIGDRVEPGSQILIDGKLLPTYQPKSTQTRVLLYHKPCGEICSRHDPENRPTIFTHLPHLNTGRWINIGRLDVSTSGLLLLTTNGELANQLMHPSSEIEREYHVRVYGDITPQTLSLLKTGVMLEDGKAHFDEIALLRKSGKNSWYRVVLKEGRNRIVRRLWLSQEIKVNRLIRVRFGSIELPDSLLPGKFVELKPSEINKLQILLKTQAI